VFISYRWENEAQIQWVRKLAHTLSTLEVAVLLDQLDRSLASRVDMRTWPREALEISCFIRKMQCCHVFMPIFTPGYLDRIGYPNGAPVGSTEQGWVFDEFQESLALGAARRIETIGVLREGNFGDLPTPFNESNTLDLRTEEGYERQLVRLGLYLHEERAVPYTLPLQSLESFWDR